MGWLSRTYNERRRAFAAANHCSEGNFLEDLGIPIRTREAVVALAIRSVIAELAEVPAESICAKHSFSGEISHLGMWDSLDTVEFVMSLEERLGLSISDAQAERLSGLAESDRDDPKYTVADMVIQMTNHLVSIEASKKAR